MNDRSDLLAGVRGLAEVGRANPDLPLPSEVTGGILFVPAAEVDATLDRLVEILDGATTRNAEVTVEDLRPDRPMIVARFGGLTVVWKAVQDVLAEVDERLPEDRETLTPPPVEVPEKLGIRSSEPIPRVEEPSGETSGPYEVLSDEELAHADEPEKLTTFLAQVPPPEIVPEDPPATEDEDWGDPPSSADGGTEPRNAEQIRASHTWLTSPVLFVTGALFVLTVVLLRPVGRLVYPPNNGRHVGAAT